VIWRDERDRVFESADAITHSLQQQESVAGSAPISASLLTAAYRQLGRVFDPSYGGFGTAPKFPPSMNLMLLLRIHRRTGDQTALEMVELTLGRMARGGIYDHLGGGFARYSTDAKWLVPHFEKMLYDNALLALAYLEGYQATGRTLYASVAREILDYVRREMTDPTGGFHSAEDAGEVGKEGEYYV
ncbi:MAG: thioredoxin domain-containing protein, partial [Planctomycetales bacterium]|nr:thioredoxin domain-containing protein [Planctomycetales bacterium]